MNTFNKDHDIIQLKRISVFFNFVGTGNDPQSVGFGQWLRRERVSDNNMSKLLRERDSVYFVAEIGQNHQGSFELAKHMIREAKVLDLVCHKKPYN